MFTHKRAVHAVYFLLGRCVLTYMLPHDGTQTVEQVGALFAVVRDSTGDFCRLYTRIFLVYAQSVIVALYTRQYLHQRELVQRFADSELLSRQILACGHIQYRLVGGAVA